MCLGSIGEIVRMWDEGGMPMAEVEVGGRTQPACLMYVPEATVSDQVLVHMGFAVEILDAARAEEARSLRDAAG